MVESYPIRIVKASSLMVAYGPVKPRNDIDLGASARRPDKEYLVGDWKTATDIRATHIPATRMQALMEAGPHQPPERSMEEAQELPAPTLECLDQLDEPWRSVIYWHVLEGRSLRNIARELGLDHPYQVSRIRDAGFEQIKHMLATTQDDWDLAK